MKYIASLSFGKDSLAQIILIKRLGLPLDDVIYCDIRYTRDVSGEMPEMTEWIPTAEDFIYCATRKLEEQKKQEKAE